MINLKFYKKLYQFIKEGGKSNRETNTWEFAFFMSVLIKKDIRCIDIIKFLFDYSYEFSPAEKQINPSELAESFKKLGSYEKVAKEYGLSYNTVRSKVESFNEFIRYLNSIGADRKFIERVYRFIDYGEGINIRELLEFREAPREETIIKNKVENKYNKKKKVNRGYKNEEISCDDEEGVSIEDILNRDEEFSLDDEDEEFSLDDDEDEGIPLDDEDEEFSPDDEWEYFHKSYDYEEYDFNID